MTNPNILTYIERLRRSEGVIEISKLESETIILIETPSQIYEIEVIETPEVRLNSFGSRLCGRYTGKLIGCLGSSDTLFAGFILHLSHLCFNSGSIKHASGQIQSATLRGRDWQYEIWSKNA